MSNENVEIIVDASDISVLSASILNSGGVPIANGIEAGGHLRAYVANLPIGTYFAQIKGTSSTVQTAYQLQIYVTGP